MENITSTAGLKYAIEQLECKHAGNAQRLEADFVIVVESLKPANLIKNAIYKLSEKHDLPGSILGGVLGLVSGYLTKKIAVGSSASIIKNILGTILQLGVTSVVTQHSKTINAIGRYFLHKIIRKKEQNTESRDKF